MTKYFSTAELQCKCGCARAVFHPGFLAELDGLREEFGLPMKPTSACRCKKHNTNVGGNPRSLHICDEPQHPGQLGTLGIDIATPDGTYRGRLFAFAWRRGWSIGWNAKRGFLHLDRRDYAGLPQTSFDY